MNLHRGLFSHQKEAKRATISGRPLLSYSRKMLASFILWMDEQIAVEQLDVIGWEEQNEKVVVQKTE